MCVIMSAKSEGANNRGGDVLRAGLLKKLKTSRKKWFVLRAETAETSARLEYYDSEKKFNAGQAAKRSIPLKTCFNINKRHDTKHKHVIALYTKDDCFCVVLDTEDELEAWLKALLSLQHGEDAADGETPRPTFEHVWQVAVLNRGLGTGRTGSYRLCLTDKTLSLIRKDDTNGTIHFQLSNIRSCGCLKNYFFLEIGRSSLLGAGEVWMESEDTNIAQNIHTTIFHAMTTNEIRGRSSSATESSKPNNAYRKQGGFTKPAFFTHAGGGGSQWWPPPGGLTISHQRTQSLPLAGDHFVATPSTAAAPPPQPPPVSHAPAHSSRVAFGSSMSFSVGNKRQLSQFKYRDRCDSMPSRPRTASEGTHPTLGPASAGRPYPAQARSHGRDLSHHQHSPPSAASPPSVGCSTDSSTGGSSYSLALDEVDSACCGAASEFGEGRYAMPLTPDEAIAEEDCPDSPPCDIHGRYVPMRPHSSDDDGYVDMSPRLRPHWLHSPGGSVVSGTPSTDIRFSDYPLDKVASYLAGAEHDDSRPIRAYSVGSRPDDYHDAGRGKRTATAATGVTTPADDARVRSFSMGSKAKRAGPSRVLPPHQHASAKSSSAPILLHSRSHSCHGSNDPMDNLMEMDFSRGSNNTLNNNSPKTPSGYVEMKPGVEIGSRKPADISSSYMDMSGSTPSINSQSEYHSFVDISRQYKITPTNNNYVDMDKGRNKAKPSTSPCWNGDYLDMSANNQPRHRSERGSSFGSQASGASSPRSGDYVPLSFAQRDAVETTPEGYVEMTPGGGNRHRRQGSLDGAQSISTSQDYLNMSCGTKNKKPATKEKAASQPISIQSVAKGSTSSPILISSLLGRKSSTGTPPKMHLPLSSWSSPYSSLPRQRTRKDSKESSGSSGVGTPSSSGAIFPMSLNSPNSPMKPAKAETTSSSAAFKIPAAILNAIYKNNNKSNIASNTNGDYASMDFEVKKGKENNLAKESAKKAKKNSDYVNYAPAPPKRVDEDDDYAMMKPGEGVEVAKPTATVPTKPMGHLSLAGGFGPIEEDAKIADEEMPIRQQKDIDTPATLEPTSSNECISPAAKISRPNSANGEPSARTSPVTANVANKAARHTVTASEPWAASVGDSDRAQQPEKLHYASLDLAQAMEEDEASGPRAFQRRGSPGGADSAAPQGEQTILYAEIDIMKSEGLKQNTNNSQSLLHNAKVKD